MRLEGNQIRFATPFFTLTNRRLVRLGGKRCSIQLQETAFVAEGELLRFTFIIGLEWLFRRALSEWTTVTVPYSRITKVAGKKLWPLRLALLLGILAVVFGAVMTWDNEAILAPILVLGIAGLVVLAYINIRIKPSVGLVFRGKDGKSRRFAFVIRDKRLRQPFIDAVRKHQADAARFATPLAGAA